MSWPFARRKTSPGGTALAVVARIAEIRRDLPHLPRRRWLGRDKASAEAEMARLRGEMIEILHAGPIIEARGTVRRLEREATEAREREAEMRERARQGSAMPRDVSRAKKEVGDAERKLDKARQAELKALTSAHVELTREQLEALTLLPGGDDDLGLIAFVSNMRGVMQALGELMSATRQGEAVKRYYQYRVILLETLLTVQERVATRIHAEYLPGIEARACEVAELARETAALLQDQTHEEARTALRANQVAQQVAARAVELARERLHGKSRRLAEAVLKTRADLDVAVNTAETARVTQDLAHLLRDTDRLFDDLTTLTVPAALPFGGDAIRAELMNLSGRLLAHERPAGPLPARPRRRTVRTSGV